MTTTLSRPASIDTTTTTVTLPEIEEMITTPGVYVVTITPELAGKLLDRNTLNRPPKRHAIAQYSGDMRKKRWRLTNQGIGFDLNGRLSDGQNRLMACILAEMPFTTLVATGLQPESRENVDIGVKRTFADVLRMNDFTNTVSLAGGANLRYRYEVLARDKRPWYQFKLRIDELRPTHEELLVYLGARPSLIERGTSESGLRKAFPSLSASTVIAFESLAYDVNPTALEEFRKSLVSGANLGEGDPRLALRNYLARTAALTRGGPHPMYMLGVMIKCWNDWLAGRPRQVVHMKDTEAMPRIVTRAKA